MSNLTTQQLAEILVGIARAQQAVIDAMENSKAGFKATHFRPTLETASRIRSNRAETLGDVPSRLLLQMLGRNGPEPTEVAKELEALLAPQPAASSGAVASSASSAAPATPPAAVAPDPDAIPYEVTRVP